MKKISFALISLMLVVGLSGCGKAQTHKDHVGTGTQSQSMMHKSNTLSNKSSTIDTYDNVSTTRGYNHRQHQSMLTQHVRNVEGVTDSTILVDDNNIIVGLDVANGADRKKVEQSVRSILLKNHNGQNVHITSESKFHDRIRKLEKQMNGTNVTDGTTGTTGTNGTNVHGLGVNNVTNDIKVLLEDIGRSINKAVR